MRYYDVVVIGAGPVGASVAWHLVSRGCRRVLVLERGPDSEQGSAAQATGGFRCQFSTPINVQLSQLALTKLLQFQDETGVDAGYVPAGYLFLATDATQLAALEAGIEVQRACGLDSTRVLTQQQIASLNPHLDSSRIFGGTFGPQDGFIRPLQIIAGYGSDAARRGAIFEFNAGDVRLNLEHERVTGVITHGESIAAGHVVIAAGAWSGHLATARIAIPVIPERRQIAVTEPFDALPESLPMTIDCTDGFHFRIRDGRVLLLRPGVPPASDPYDTGFESSWVAGVLAVARRWVPCLEAAQIDPQACRAGLYEMTPDRHALVGPVPETPSLVLATGNSGHGVMHSPALGQVVSEMILDGQAGCLDATPLRPERFRDGAANPISGVL